MAVTTAQKSEIVKKFQASDLDTGSTPVQIALLTVRINELTTHFAVHKKDVHGRRGLIKAVNQRRKLLDYLKKTDLNKYNETIKALDIRK